MKWFWRKVAVIMTAYYAHMLEYRAEIFFWALAGCLPLILMGAWLEASSQGDFGLQTSDFAHYFLCVFLIRQFTNVWVVWEFEKQVLRGTLSFRLLQPLDPVWHHVARHLTEKITRIPFVVVFIALFFLLYPQAIWIPSLPNLALGLITTAMAFSLNFSMQYTFAMFAFWTERAHAIEQLSFLVFLFLSGLIAPLEVFPPLIRNIALCTPYPYLVHFPASLFIGLPVNIGQGFVVMLLWLSLFLLLNRWLWRRGLRKYSGMGA